MLKRIRAAGIDEAALFAPLMPFARIGLAVSGGPDSLALMLLAADWARQTDKKLVVYSVDHRLRPEAAGECAMVADQARKLGLCCRVLAWTGPKPKTGIQAAARVARYRLIGEAMRADAVEILVTAHHLNDQAETVLMRLAHGSGLAGLAGMTLFGTVEGVAVCRPLLGIDPDALHGIVAEADLAPAADPTNRNDKYERVRWRRLLPALGEEGLDAERLAGFARRMARADLALRDWADRAYAALAILDGFAVVTLPAEGLFALPAEIGLRVVERCVDWAGGEAEPCRLGQLEALYDRLCAAEPGFAATLAGIVAQRRADSVLFFREAGRLEHTPARLPPGASLIWDDRFTYSCGDTARQEPYTVRPAGKSITRAEAENLAGPVAAPMRALRAAPAVRNERGELVALGTFVKPGTGVTATLAFKTKPRRFGQNSTSQDKRS